MSTPAASGPVVADHADRSSPASSSIDTSVSGAGLHIEIRCDSGPVRLRGDLDLAAAPLLTDAVASYRLRHPGRRVVIDTSELHFIDVSGLRALQRAMSRPDGTPDPTVAHVAGPVVRRLTSAIGACR